MRCKIVIEHDDGCGCVTTKEHYLTGEVAVQLDADGFTQEGAHVRIAGVYSHTVTRIGQKEGETT